MKNMIFISAFLGVAFSAGAWGETNTGTSSPQATPGSPSPSNVGPGDDGSSGTTHKPDMPNKAQPNPTSGSGSGSGNSGTAGPYNPTSPTAGSGAVAQ